MEKFKTMCWIKRKLRGDEKNWAFVPEIIQVQLGKFFPLWPVIISRGSLPNSSSFFLGFLSSTHFIPCVIFSLTMSCSHSLQLPLTLLFSEPSLTLNCLLYYTSPFKCLTRTPIYPELNSFYSQTSSSACMPYPPRPSSENPRSHW